MDKEKRAEVLVARLKKCLAAVKILIWIPVALVVALTVFAAVAAGTGFGDGNKITALAIMLILGGTAALAAIAVTGCFVVAYISLSALKKLDGEEERPDGENQPAEELPAGEEQPAEERPAEKERPDGEGNI